MPAVIHKIKCFKKKAKKKKSTNDKIRGIMTPSFSRLIKPAVETRIEDIRTLAPFKADTPNSSRKHQTAFSFSLVNFFLPHPQQ